MRLQAQALRRSSGDVALPRRAALATRVAAVPLASAAQPVLRVAGGLAARVLGSGVLLNLARSARGALSGRAGPFVFAGLLAYSVAVTLYAAQASSRANSTAASSGGSSNTAVAEPPEPEAPESFAEAVAASALADLPPGPSFSELERKLEKIKASAAAPVAISASASSAQPVAKKEDRVMCKVCNGSGQVAYENHMMLYDGTVCPCCLGKGTVKNKRGDLISCLLTFDP